MPYTQSIVAAAAVCGAAFLAFGLYRLWSVWTAVRRGRRRRGRLRLPSPGSRDRPRQTAFALAYLAIGVFLLFGARPRPVLIREPQGVPLPGGLAAEVAAIVAAEGRPGGLVVGAVRGAESVLVTLGALRLASAQPPRGDTVFAIGSITKTFTGILLADMAARGEVSESAPVRRHLPPGAAPATWQGEEITLLDLATHTSGLPRMPPYMAPRPAKLLTWQMLRDRYRGHTPAELFARLGEIPLAAPPGTAFAYSNLGMGLLGHALERAAGAGYEELVRRRIAEPLAMTSVRIRLTPELAPRLAPGFFGAWRLGPVGVELPAPRWEYPVLQGAGALVASGEDLLRYLEANLSPPATPLGDAIRESHRRRRDRDAEGGGIGLGWHLTPPSAELDELVWHSGATSGYTSFLGLLPRRGIGLFVLHNTAEPVDDLAREILAAIAAPPATG